MRILSTLTRSLWRKVQRSIELNRYDDFTIAEYFRKQGAVIGERTRIEIRNLGHEPYLIRIGNHCTIAPGVAFICHDGAAWVFTEEYPSLQKFGTIEIKDNCFIGINACIMGNVTIGPNAVVGACSVVTKDVPPNAVAAGNPAKVVSTLAAYKEKVLAAWARQKPQGYLASLADGVEYDPAYIQSMKFTELKKLRDHLVRVCWERREAGGLPAGARKEHEA